MGDSMLMRRCESLGNAGEQQKDLREFQPWAIRIGEIAREGLEVPPLDDLDKGAQTVVVEVSLKTEQVSVGADLGEGGNGTL
jgi:hypothetical protein